MSYLRRDLLIFFIFLAAIVPPACYFLFGVVEGTRLIVGLVVIAISVPLVLIGVVFHALVCDDAQGIEGHLALDHPEHLTERGRWYRRAYFIWAWAMMVLQILGGCLASLLAVYMGPQ